MRPEELQKDIAKKNIAPLYYFHGENTHKTDELLQKITAVLFPAGDPEFDSSSLDAQVHAPSEVLQSARTVPFGNPKRLTVVKQADAYKEAQWKSFEGYFSKPSVSSCLIFVGEKCALKGALLKLFQKQGKTVAFDNPRWESQIKACIREELSRHKKTATDAALSYMADSMGGDAQMISREVEKIVLFCREQKRLDVDDVAEIVSGAHTATIFNLVDGIGGGRIDDSLKYLNSLVDEGVYSLVILKMISRQFRLIGRAREGMNQGEAPGRIGQRIGLKNERLVKNILNQAKGWPSDKLGRVFDVLYQTHMQLKTSRVKDAFVLENLLFQLVALRR